MGVAAPPQRRRSKATIRRRRQRLAILRLYREGLTPAAIAREPGVTYTEQWVRRILRRYEAQHTRRRGTGP